MRGLISEARGLVERKRGGKGGSYKAFDKYNAPEVLSHLLAVLANKGLSDAVNQIRMKGITKLVDAAWKSTTESSDLEERLQGSDLDLWRMLSPFTRGKKLGVLPVSKVSKSLVPQLVHGGYATKTGSSLHLTKKAVDVLQSFRRQLSGYAW